MMNRTEDEIAQYYEDLAEFINENSGLDAVDSKQVQLVCRLSKGFVGTHEGLKESKPQRAWNPQRPCSARRTNGEPCRKAAINGANVCRTHGGAAKQTVNAARIRLQNASFQMAKELLNMATDENVSDATKLKAITEALDRGGLATKSTVDLDISVKPYETIFEQLSGGSRAAHRGEEEPQQPALAASHQDAIDVQIVEDDLDGGLGPDLNDYSQPIMPEVLEDGSAFDSSPPPEGLMPLDEAVAAMAVARRQSAAGSTRIHRPQRALPPGRSARSSRQD